MKITDTDHTYIFGQTTKIRNALCCDDLIVMNTEAIRLAMHIQDLIKKEASK
jgi:hypothetical protein